MRDPRLLFVLAAVGGLMPQAAAGQGTDAPPPEEGSSAVTPASDKEETGALTDLLPNRVETLPLPQEDADGDGSPGEMFASRDDSLFPDELWPPAPPVEPLEETEKPAPVDLIAPSIDEPLPPEIAATCFGPSPPPALHDPQKLLTPAQTAPLLALLHNSLNARGSFQTSIVVLKPSQQMPVALNPPELLQRWYGDGKGLLILYFLGQPNRTQAFFSPETRRFHRSEDLRQVIDFSVNEAARMSAPVTQLQRFCYKAAIRLDRLHRQGVVALQDETEPATAQAPATGLWWAFAVGAQATALAAAAVWWGRRRPFGSGKKGEPVFFPEQDLICRLGGYHSGGSGAVLQFGAAVRRI
jgi:hypothetical protein